MEFDPFRRTGVDTRVTRDKDVCVIGPLVGQPGSMERFLAATFIPEKKAETMAQYIVWNPASTIPPKVIHADRPTAIRVAGRMAHENPGQTFYVCKLTNKAVKPLPVDVTYEDLDR